MDAGLHTLSKNAVNIASSIPPACLWHTKQHNKQPVNHSQPLSISLINFVHHQPSQLSLHKWEGEE
jgi:hypothetical protein